MFVQVFVLEVFLATTPILRALANTQPSTGRLGWAVQIGNLLGGFSLTKIQRINPGS